MVGEYVKYDGEYYVIVMTGSKCYGVVTLRSRACSQAVVIVLEQECASIVTGRERQFLIALHGDPTDIVEYLIGNILTEERHESWRLFQDTHAQKRRS
jgi:hypothetical protein